MHVRPSFLAALATAVAIVLPSAIAFGQEKSIIDGVISELNSSGVVKGTEDSKSYKILFDAYLNLSKPPMEVGDGFNLTTIHPGMSDWAAVSNWAESNRAMANAIHECKDRIIVGLPYGLENVSEAYRESGLCVAIGVDGSLRNNEFLYLPALDTIMAFATAEMYRLAESGYEQHALDLAVAQLYVLRQFCDREFLAEKTHCINLLSQALVNLRDVLYIYLDRINAEDYAGLAFWDIPYLRPDRSFLFMPEADRILSEALIRQVFDERSGRADPETFASAFAAIQAKDSPLTQFGAARRWQMISEVHGSLDASLEKLKLIYDDWWRRWRIQSYEPILDIPTEFERVNPIRYAAVIYSMQNIQGLFVLRDRLIAEVRGTAMAAALCAYQKTFDDYPNDTDMLYGQFLRATSDSDPFDLELDKFEYRRISARHSVDTPAGRIWVEPDQCDAILYSVGMNHVDERGEIHDPAGETAGDIVLWPPVQTLERQSGLIK